MTTNQKFKVLPTEQRDALIPFRALRDALNGAFFERTAEVRALIVALLAEEHVLLLGPPGTGKSALTVAFTSAFDGATYFERLLTPFSVPEEVFGPFSINGLQNDRYERQIQGYLPTATVAFLDECFKANSAILNSLLTLLNERKFDQGSKRISCPLQICIGASNELPADASLDALYDRFMLRRWVAPIKSEANLRSLIGLSGAPMIGARISDQEISEARKAVSQVIIADETVDALLTLKVTLMRECGIEISDRRLRKAVSLVRAYATLQGCSVARPAHLEILIDALWNKPDEAATVAGQVLKVANPNRAKATKILDAAIEAMASLDLKALSASNIATGAAINGKLKDMSREITALNADGSVQDIALQIEGMQEEIARALIAALSRR